MIRRVLVTLVVVVSSVGAVSPPSRRPRRAQAAVPSFALAAQSPWVAPDGTFLMSFQAANVPPGSRVVLTVHDPLESRTAFDESVSGGGLPPSRNLTPFAFDELPTDANGHRILLYPTNAISSSGVYPLEVDLRSASRRVARPLRHPRRGRAPGRRRRAHLRNTPPGGLGLATPSRTRLRGQRGGAGQREHARRPPADGPARPPGERARGEPRRAAHAGAQSRDPRRVEHARGPVTGPGGGRRRRPERGPAQPGAHRSVRPPRPARHPAERPRRRREPAAGVGVRTRGRRRSRPSSVPISTPAPRCPAPSTSRRCACS